MAVPPPGVVDCDVHISVPSTRALLPYLDEYWREHMVLRGMHETNDDLGSYPASSPLSCRPDWRPEAGPPGSDLGVLQKMMDAFGTEIAIANCLSVAHTTYSEDLAGAYARAINRWIAEEWLSADRRLRASLVVTVVNPEVAVREIEYWAKDDRFVQVLLLAMGEAPLGRKIYWPIYEAAERHGLPVAIHPGSNYRHPTTSLGWPSYLLEDYVAQSQAIASQLNSFFAEGVFVKFPELKLVLLESGVTWLPPYLWRANKSWRALRPEIPWNKRPPAEVVREKVRLPVQPFDGPPTDEAARKVLDLIRGDHMFLFATDFPHWHFDGTDALAPVFGGERSADLYRRNAFETYPRLGAH